MQRVEIIRALLTNPKLLILDEPTSVLTPQAVDKLFVVLKKLASEGCSILYISHKLHEIRELCTACTVLRGGKVTGVCNPAEESNASLSRLMIGAEPPAADSTATQKPGAPVLQVSGPEPAARGPVRRRPGRHLAAGLCRRGGRHRRRVGQRPEGTAVCPVGRGLPQRGGHHPHGRDRHVGAASGRAAQAGPAFRAGGAAGPRRRADAGAGAQPAADAQRGLVGPASTGSSLGTLRRRRPTSSGASTSRPAGPMRRRVRCRAAICRSSSSGARSTPSRSC